MRGTQETGYLRRRVTVINPESKHFVLYFIRQTNIFSKLNLFIKWQIGKK